MTSRLVGIVAATALLLVSCTTTADAGLPYVDLSQRVPFPAEGTGDVRPFRVAVGAILSPEGTLESYAAFADFLEQELERPVEIVQRRTYGEINDLLESGEADIGFVCTSAYVSGRDSFRLELLAAPEIGGETVYYSEVIVGADSTAISMADLQGARFAFTDPISTTGRVYPTYLVQELGGDPSTFFSSTFFTYSHDRAIEAVAKGLADGAAVDSLVLDYALARDPSLGSAVKVVHRSPAFGIPPVVASPTLSAAQRAQLETLLLSLADMPEARPVLEALGIDRFVHIDDAAYDSVREVFHAIDGER